MGPAFRTRREAARALRELKRIGGEPALAQALARLSPDDANILRLTWELVARAKQLRPVDCLQIWLVLAGRGFGKTRLGAEWICNEHEERGPFRGALLAKSADDMRSTMIGQPFNDFAPGEPQGLRAVAERRGIPFKHIENKSLVLLGPPNKRSVLNCYGAHQSEFGRGAGLSLFWADEIAAWPARAAQDMRAGFLPSVRAKFRDGSPMRGLITTTPQPNPITKWLLGKDMSSQVTITRGTSEENRHITLSAYAESIRGSREWLQEYEAILLDTVSLLTQAMLDASRVDFTPPELSKVVVAIDPGLDNHAESDATGIVVAGADYSVPSNAYVLEDLTAARLSFTGWSELAVDTAVKYRDAFRCPVEIVGEINQGGRGGVIDAIESATRRRSDAYDIRVTDVHATVSKRARAEPVATLFETNQAHMVGRFPALEQEWTTWTEGEASPNRLDACVYAVKALLLRDVSSLPVWSPHE